MPIVIGPKFLPAKLTAQPMTDDEFAAFCTKHPDLCLEMTAEGELLVMPPNYPLTGNRCIRIGGRCRGIVCGSSSNGAQLGWLIDPEAKSVTIYRPGQDPEARTGIDSIEGERPVAGFVLDLGAVWNPLG